MMRILILCAGNLRHMSMISIYTEHLKELGIIYDLLYMDKYGEEEQNEATNVYRFENVVQPEWGRLKKILHYMRFRPYATRIMNKNDYNFIIVWKDTTSFMFADYLARKWKGKYCLNVRDDNHYQNKILKKWYEKVFRNAAFITISSDAYRRFLPPYDYIHIHSLNEQALKSLKPRHSLRETGNPIRIGFIGYVRFFDINQKLLDIFSNDPRFELHYYGTHANVLKEYAQQNSIKNAIFYDSFPVEETAQYLQNIDIMNNVYGNDTENLRTALSIKLYHAIWARIPILVSPNTYMEKITTEIGIGFVVKNIDSETKEALYQWYRQLNFYRLDASCIEYVRMIQQNRSAFENVFDRYIAGEVE